MPYFHGLGNHDRGGIVDYGHYPHEPCPDQPMSVEYYRYYFGMRYQSRDIGPLHVVLPYCPDHRIDAVMAEIREVPMAAHRWSRGVERRAHCLLWPYGIN